MFGSPLSRENGRDFISQFELANLPCLTRKTSYLKCIGGKLPRSARWSTIELELVIVFFSLPQMLPRYTKFVVPVSTRLSLAVQGTWLFVPMDALLIVNLPLKAAPSFALSTC